MTTPVPPGNLPPHIGPYRILQVLGEGGMGVVYEAEETGPVRRRVAVKVMRAGLDSREVVARFETERQALAVMNHPGIARVLGAGTTTDGRPYFAMELVRGLPITRYCDTHRLSLEQRLELYIAVCHAVQHAHQKGVTHRDLKPTNILVTDVDGTAQPKIIDFGIAKALGQRLTDLTLVTLSGHAMGTAAYMSPEQADPAGVDTDTRADIYSLGVVLYELLVGELPVDPDNVGLHLFLARLAAGEANPPTPSARLASDPGHAQAVAIARGTDAAKLRRRLRGDLDWIVMKAMAPERSRRYDTANGLALELRRFLNSEPVLARSPSTRYRVVKFIGRHRVGVALAGLASVLVLGSAVAATLGLVRASRAERAAAEEAQAAAAVTDFLVELFRDADPAQAGGAPVTALALLSRGAERARTELTDQPLHQARLLHTLGSVHATLSQFTTARELLQDALRIRERELGAEHPALVETLTALADATRDHGQLEEAERHYTRAVELGTTMLGREQIQTASALAGLAALRVRQGQYAAAESLYREVLPLDELVRPAGDPRIARNIRSLGVALYAQQRYPEAEALYRRALGLQERTLGRRHMDVAGTLTNLGASAFMQGRYDEAEALYRQAEEIYDGVLAGDHTLKANIYNNYGETDWKRGRLPSAEAWFRRALAMKERVLAPNHTSIANTLSGLANVLRDQGRYREAEPLLRRALEIRERAYDEGHPQVQESRADYAELRRRMGVGGR